MFFCLVLREPLLQAKRANIERSFRNTPRNKHPQQSPQQPPQHRKHTSPAKIPPQAHIPWKNPSRKRTSPAKIPPRAHIPCKNPTASAHPLQKSHRERQKRAGSGLSVPPAGGTSAHPLQKSHRQRTSFAKIPPQARIPCKNQTAKRGQETYDTHLHWCLACGASGRRGQATYGTHFHWCLACGASGRRGRAERHTAKASEITYDLLYISPGRRAGRELGDPAAPARPGGGRSGCGGRGGRRKLPRIWYTFRQAAGLAGA